MRTHSNEYKENVNRFARELDSKIIYTLNNETTELGAEELNSVSLHYEGAILKSVMKQLDIDSNTDIPLETEINAQFGVKVGNQYEYINLGNFIVYKSEKQEDMNSYNITCYDKMLYAMKNYENISYSFPMTIREYIGQICSSLGLTFANSLDTFANYDKQLTEDMFLDANGQFLGYKFRDVLDQLAEVTASIICINNSDELEIRYINETNDVIDEEYLKDVNVNFGEKYGPINSIVLSRAGESDNVFLKDDDSISQNGLCEIKIIDNQIMSKNDRSDYLEDILDTLDGLEYYINDFSSTGITYYELFDKYTVSIGNNNYNCIMFNDEINITQGLEELIYTNMPEQSETPYDKADKTDRRINQAYSLIDKQNQVITSFVSQTTETQQLNNERILQLTEITNSVQQQITSTNETIEVLQREVVDGRETLKNNLVTIDINGINVSTNISAISTLMTNEKFVIKSGYTTLAFFGYDADTNSTKAEMDNLTIKNYLTAGYHRVERMTVNGENRTGWFYVG